MIHKLHIITKYYNLINFILSNVTQMNAYFTKNPTKLIKRKFLKRLLLLIT